MPLQKRVTEPVHVCRGIVPEDFSTGQTQTLRRNVPNELECVTNGTLANVIRQLSSLSKHAENLFGELYQDCCCLVQRTNGLQGRIDRLAVKVTQLDSNVEEVSLHDIHLRKAFKSSSTFDQQVVSRETIPTSMLETYRQCDRPPPLDKLNAYREDGKDGLKFYTDPDYFFELWRQEMLKDTERIERMMQDKGRKPHQRKTEKNRNQRRVRQPQNTKEQYVNAVPDHEFIGTRPAYGNPNQIRRDEYGQMNHYQSGQQPALRPNSLELQNPYDPQAMYGRTIVSPTSNYQQQLPPPYIENQPAYSQYQPPPPYTPTPDNMMLQQQQHHTPTRQISRSGSNARPAHPPPAPPNPSGSGSSTPILGSGQGGTPVSIRNKMGGPVRESLPPPPPPPNENLPNGPIPSHVKGVSMQSRSSTPGTPGSLNGTPTHHHHLLQQQQSTSGQQNMGGGAAAEGCESVEQGTPDSMDLPPPPPTPDKDYPKISSEEQMPSPPPLSADSANSTPPGSAIPAPPPLPPPPPPPVITNGPVVVNGDLGKATVSEGAVTTSTTNTTNSPKTAKDGGEGRSRSSHNNSQLPPFHDARSDLLAAIREGIKLRKVEDNRQKEVEKHTAPHDVASILARRVAMEFSDSDTASESEYDSEAWDDDGST